MEYSRRLVGFVDVLGFSELLRSAATPRRARLLIELFELVSAKHLGWGEQKYEGAGYSARLFSDCACVVAARQIPEALHLRNKVSEALGSQAQSSPASIL